MKRFVPTIVLLLLVVSAAHAELAHFSPGQNFAYVASQLEAGDTILFAPGHYRSASYDLKPFTIGSWFLITGDPHYISSTVLDNDHEGDHLLQAAFGSFQGDAKLVIDGLTLTGCNSRIFNIYNVDTKISNCKILENSARCILAYMNSLEISNCVFTSIRLVNNPLFYIQDIAAVDFSKVVVAGNSIVRILQLSNFRSLTVDRSTFAYNQISSTATMAAVDESDYDVSLNFTIDLQMCNLPLT